MANTIQYTGRIYVVWLLASMSQHSSTTVYCMNSVVFHFSTVCGILQFFDAVLRYLATVSCGIAVLGPPRSTPQIVQTLLYHMAGGEEKL